MESTAKDEEVPLSSSPPESDCHSTMANRVKTNDSGGLLAQTSLEKLKLNFTCKRINNVGRQWLCSRQLTLLPSSSTHWRRIFSSAKVAQSAIAKWAKRFFRMKRKISIFIYSEWGRAAPSELWMWNRMWCGVCWDVLLLMTDKWGLHVRWMCPADDYGFAQHRHSFCLVGCQAQHTWSTVVCLLAAGNWRNQQSLSSSRELKVIISLFNCQQVQLASVLEKKSKTEQNTLCQQSWQ